MYVLTATTPVLDIDYCPGFSFLTTPLGRVAEEENLIPITLVLKHTSLLTLVSRTMLEDVVILTNSDF